MKHLATNRHKIYFYTIMVLVFGAWLYGFGGVVQASHTSDHCETLFPGGGEEALLNECLANLPKTANDCEILFPGGGEEALLNECLAQFQTNNPDATTPPVDSGFQPPAEITTDASCGGVGVAIDVGCEGDEPVMAYANAIVNFLAAGVGMAAIIMVAVGGVQYISSGGNPQATQAALGRIMNAVIGLLFFIFLWAFLQWLIPGGPF